MCEKLLDAETKDVTLCRTIEAKLENMHEKSFPSSYIFTTNPYTY